MAAGWQLRDRGWALTGTPGEAKTKGGFGETPEGGSSELGDRLEAGPGRGRPWG